MKTISSLLCCGVLAAAVMTACHDGSPKTNDSMKTENALSEAEKTAGILTPEVLWKMGRVGSAVLSPDGATVLYTVSRYSVADNKSQTLIWSVPSAGGESVLVTEGAAPRWSGDGSRIYYLCSQGGSSQLWSAAPDGTQAAPVTDIADGIEDYGVSPDGKNLYYIQRVKVEKRSGAELYGDVPESKVKIYDDLMARHWNYWDDGSYLHIFVAPLTGSKAGQGEDILAGEPWDAPTAPYFDGGEIAWNNAGTQLAYTCKKLAGKEYALSTDSDIFLYDLASGQTRNLTPGMPGYDKYPVFSPDDATIAFTSMRRAGNESDKDRLMVVDLSTGAMADLTAGFDYNAGNIRWASNELLYFIAPIQATYQLCRVSYPGAGKQSESAPKVEVITRGDHDLNAFTMADGKMVAELTTLSSPCELYTVNLKDGALTRLTVTDSEIDRHIRMGEVRKRWVKTTDGQSMLTWVVLPPDFDSTKSYPVLLYCQGGPQSVVSQRWSYRWNLQAMAAQGYVVVAPNRRGLPSFGQQWLDQISGDYSGQNIRDYLSAIDDVARESWADENRMGCVGASYGGYSAYFLAGHHQKRFKAFIAHCGMFNFESMYGSTEELWFPNNDLGGPYWSEDPVAKRSYANSPHRFVQNWDTPIMIIVGLNDFRIPYAESLQAFTAAQLRGIPSRLVVFENEGHQVFKPQNSLVWQREFFGWLDKYVKNAPQGESKK